MPVALPLSIPPLRCAAGLACAALAASLAGCAAGPDYVRPTMAVPASYKEAGPWKPAQPKAVAGNLEWWRAYGDATLDDLAAQAVAANQSIRQAEAQYRQAQAVAAAARASLWPSLGANAGVDRALTNSGRTGPSLDTTYSVGLAAAWEPDLWGRLRRSVEAGAAASQASQADLAAARLSIVATLAQDYMQLRVTDMQSALYTQTLHDYERALALAKSQYTAGVALRSDVALAQNQLSATRAQALDLQWQRVQLEHAIAVLVGKAPADFAIAAQPLSRNPSLDLPMRLPEIPVGVPSELLEHRPDIAAAERRAAAANADIGVAEAAYFPDLVLTASGGYSSTSLAHWFSVPGQVWGLGASLAQALFDGGLRKANDEQAIASYDAAVAQYKQTVLGGFQEVEDNLAALRILAREIAEQKQAVESARLADSLAMAQYRAGTSTYLGVITAQTLTLSAERSLLQLHGRQLVASVALIKATGGGWSAGRLMGGDSSAAAGGNAMTPADEAKTVADKAQ